MSGGAIFFSASEVKLVNSTVWGNKSDSAGGGVYANVNPSFEVMHSTIVGNQANIGGGIYNGLVFSPISIINSIVLGNSADTINEIAAFSPAGIGSTYAEVTPDDSTIVSGEIEDIFAKLDENGVPVLADNGGPVLTLALKDDPNNPALDAVTSTLTDDARGGARPDDGAADVGAFELAQGSDDADIMIGTAYRDNFDALDGDDLLFGLDGWDFINGGLGQDTIFGGRGQDNINGNNGADTISGGSGADKIVGGKGNDVLDGNKGADKIFGNNGNDNFIRWQGC